MLHFDKNITPNPVKSIIRVLSLSLALTEFPLFARFQHSDATQFSKNI